MFDWLDSVEAMGYGPEDKNAVLELTYNYGVKEYDKGNAYAQVRISFPAIKYWWLEVQSSLFYSITYFFFG